MRNSFTFGQISTADYGIWVFKPLTIQTPEKPYEVATVPGKNGDIPIGGDSVSNEIIPYQCVFLRGENGYGDYDTLDEAVSAFRNAILTTKGYRVLEDSFDNVHYRKAYYAGPVDIIKSADYTMAKCTLEFNAMPKRFITLPAISVGADATKTLSLTEFPADKVNLEPVITVTGTGTITFKDMSDNVLKTITVTQNPGTVVVNSQLKECYSGSNSANSFVQFNDYQFPAFGPFYGYAGQVKVTTVGVSLSIDPGGYEL